ncbi:MAG: DUF4149 domain-containing protein [Terriglobia bacterium]
MGRRRAVVIALMSIWVAWTLFMWFAATRSFRTADRLLEKPQPAFARMIQPLQSPRALLRYVASQVNSTYFHAYGLAQIVIGIILLGFVVWRMPQDKTAVVLIAVMLGLVVVLAIFVEPQINRLGGDLSLNPSSSVAPRFWMLHGVYTALDSTKLLAGIVLLVRWIVTA